MLRPRLLSDWNFTWSLPAISCLLSAVTLDLSQYAMDIGKAIASKALKDAQLTWFCIHLVEHIFKATQICHKGVICHRGNNACKTGYSIYHNCVYLISAVVCVSGQLKANNAQLMEEAIQAMQNLAQQCSDPSAVQDIVTHLFKILGGKLITYHSDWNTVLIVLGLLTWIIIAVVAGSEGKLTVIAQKMSVLSGKRPCKQL